MSARSRFLWLLGELRHDGRPMTLSRLAWEALRTKSHSHLSQVVHGHGGRGRHTRMRVAYWLTERFPNQAPEILAELGWERDGTLRAEVKS